MDDKTAKALTKALEANTKAVEENTKVLRSLQPKPNIGMMQVHESLHENANFWKNVKGVGA